MSPLARICTAFLLLFSLPLHAAPGWIGDTIFVPVRSGPGSNYRIIDKGLKTGTRVEVLDWDAAENWVEIRHAGDEGYVGKQYVSRTPPAAIVLERRKQDFDRADEKLKAMRSEVAQVKSERDQLQKEKAAMQARLQRIQQELKRLQRAAAEPLKLQRENQALTERVQKLTEAARGLQEENAGLRGDRLYRGWRYALATVFGGMFLGWLITSQTGRRRSEWR